MSGPNVLLVGDSLLSAAKDDVESAVREQGWNPTIKAVPGTAIEDWVDGLPGIAFAAQPQIAVIELGTNNCGPVRECPFLGPYIDQLMHSMPTAEAVLWLNTQTDVYPEFLPTNSWAAVNAQLEEAAARWPKLWLVDMSGHFSGHPEWHDPDAVHLNAEGNRQLAALIAESLAPFRPA